MLARFLKKRKKKKIYAYNKGKFWCGTYINAKSTGSRKKEFVLEVAFFWSCKIWIHPVVQSRTLNDVAWMSIWGHGCILRPVDVSSQLREYTHWAGDIHHGGKCHPGNEDHHRPCVHIEPPSFGEDVHCQWIYLKPYQVLKLDFSLCYHYTIGQLDHHDGISYKSYTKPPPVTTRDNPAVLLVSSAN